jgi:hypothetical protein
VSHLPPVYHHSGSLPASQKSLSETPNNNE